MGLVFVKELLGVQVIQSICWTLLHSLWQGLILIILTGGVLMLTRKRSAAFRYNIFSSLFVLFFITTGVTFYREMQQPVVNDTPTVNFVLVRSDVKNIPAEPTASAAVSADTNSSQQFMDKGIDFLNRNAVLVVSIWLVILFIQSMKMLIGIGYIQRIRTYRVHEPEDDWQDILYQLADRIGVTGTVTLLESEIVKVPMVAGFLKPTVLVPLGLLAQLPPDQVEGILLHELAHIRRKDYLINILQRIATMLFFFNPALLWLSALIREEREHCCDDLAVAGSKNKMGYLNALVSFQEFNLRLSGMDMAMGFAGRKQSLLGRIQRMVSGNNNSLNLLEKVLIVFSLVIITSAVFIPNMVGKAQSIVSETITITRVLTTQEGDKRMRLVEVRDDDGKEYKILTVNRVVTEFYISGKKVPVEEIFSYKEMVTKIDNQLEAQRKDEEERARQREAAFRADPMNRPREDVIKREKELAKGRKEREAKWAEEWRVAKETDDRRHQERIAKRQQNEKTIGLIVADLVKEKIIGSAAELSNLSLDNGEFIVNDKKMSYDIYNRYKTKYLQSVNDNFKYNFPNR